MIESAARQWRNTHVKNLPPLQLPHIGGAQHADMIQNQKQTVSIGIQVNLNDASTGTATGDSPVQVDSVAVLSKDNLLHLARQKLGIEFEDSDSEGSENDPDTEYEFDIDDDL